MRARIAMLTIAIQALFLSHPNGEAALNQLRRLAAGSRELMQGHAIDHATLDRLDQYRRGLISAIGCPPVRTDRPAPWQRLHAAPQGG